MHHDGRGLTPSSVFLASLVMWVTSAIALTACNGGSEAVDPPVVAGVDSPDQELARFLNGMIQDARSLPDSGLMRGRLAMAYENNLFPEEALVSYAQAAALDPEDFRWPYFSALLKGRQGRYQAALDDLDRAIGIDADYAPGLAVARHLAAGSRAPGGSRDSPSSAPTRWERKRRRPSDGPACGWRRSNTPTP